MTTTGPATTNALRLPGLDGSNPLGFLAALGMLRVIDASTPTDAQPPRMRWVTASTSWIPELYSIYGGLDEVVDAVMTRVGAHAAGEQEGLHLHIGDNLSIPPEDFRAACLAAMQKASHTERGIVDHLASFGSDALRHEKLPRILATELQFIAGSGHQHYLDTARQLHAHVTKQHIRSAIAETWKYRDKKLSFRWDPLDAREYAYQADNPSNTPARAEWGANHLAFEGTALMSTFPTGRGVRTSCFANVARRRMFRWPIWTSSLNLEVVRTALNLNGLFDIDESADELRERGIGAVFESEKIKLGDGANYKWSFSPARAVL